MAEAEDVPESKATETSETGTLMEKHRSGEPQKGGLAAFLMLNDKSAVIDSSLNPRLKPMLDFRD